MTLAFQHSGADLLAHVSLGPAAAGSELPSLPPFNPPVGVTSSGQGQGWSQQPPAHEQALQLLLRQTQLKQALITVLQLGAQEWDRCGGRLSACMQGASNICARGAAPAQAPLLGFCKLGQVVVRCEQPAFCLQEQAGTVPSTSPFHRGRRPSLNHCPRLPRPQSACTAQLLCRSAGAARTSRLAARRPVGIGHAHALPPPAAAQPVARAPTARAAGGNRCVVLHLLPFVCSCRLHCILRLANVQRCFTAACLGDRCM